MSSPSRSTSPASWADGTSSCIRLRIRRNVDLPQPDGPISAVMPPAGMVSDTRSRTLWLPNQAVMSRASISASRSGVAGTPGITVVSSIAVLMSFLQSFEWCGCHAGPPGRADRRGGTLLLLGDGEALGGAGDSGVAAVDGLELVLAGHELHGE